MLHTLINILGWNVRGLNDQDRKDTVHGTIANSSCHIACLQETKLQAVSPFDAIYIGATASKASPSAQLWVPMVGSCCCGMILW
jgi:hypothetical protein